MNSDIQIPEINIPTKIKQFFGTAFTTLIAVFTVHLITLAIYAFWEYDMALVVSGFAFSSWEKWQRGLFLVPYLVFPVTYAVTKVAGFNLSVLMDKLKRITKSIGQVDNSSK
ncbi:putative TMhelix containing protein II [Vibrio virus VPMCC5]|nr:putative TMhelix containing protein II [Vibrio virus VPMCC5]